MTCHSLGGAVFFISIIIRVCDEQHPRADQNIQHVFDEQHTRAGRNIQPSTKSKKLIQKNVKCKTILDPNDPCN